MQSLRNLPIDSEKKGLAPSSSFQISFAVILLVLFVGRIVWLLEPLGISVDESTYLAVAEAWHHYGRLYVDAVDRKPPLVYGLYDLVGNIFGFWNIHAIHFCYFIIAALLCLIIDKMARLIDRDLPIGVAGLLYAIVSVTFTREFISCNAEVAMMLPLSLSFWILLYSPFSRSSGQLFGMIFISAALAATATLFKQVAAFPYAFAIIAWCLLLLSRKDFKRVLIISLGVLFGVASVYAVTCYFFYRAGSLQDFLYWNLFDNLNYVEESRMFQSTPRPIFTPFLVSLVCWPVLWWGVVRRLRKIRDDWKSERLVILYFGTLGALALISAAGRLFSHYFVPFSWFLSLLAAGEVYSLFLNSRTRAWAIAGLLVPLAVLFSLTTFRDQTFALLRPGKKSHTFDRTTQRELKDVSEAVRKMTNPDDRIVVWGMASQIYVESERGSGTRFIPADYASGRMGGFSSKMKAAPPMGMKLYLEDIRKKKPALFVDTSTAGLNDYQYFPVSDYPELQSLLDSDYQKATVIEGFTLWKRKSNQ